MGKAIDRNGSIEISVFGFEGTNLHKMARWLSWLERRPVTAEVRGSNPLRVAQTEYCLKIERTGS